MIRLRSAMPNSGLLTLRHQLPPLNPVNIADLMAEADQDQTDLTEKGGDAR
jgi:hypothetical protein